jgi:two-component system, OmpR family, sensor histidine kinase ChvG
VNSGSYFQKHKMRWHARFKLLIRKVSSRLGSSLSRRIVLLNLVGLVALLVGFLYLNQFREGLIEARVQSLLTQGEIISSAIAASATVETDTIMLDPEKLLQLQTGESSNMSEDGLSPLEFAINPERIAPVLRRLVTPTRTRARIYDREGMIVLDSRALYVRGDISRLDLPPVNAEPPTLIERGWNLIRRKLTHANVPRFEDIGPSNGKRLAEVEKALNGNSASTVRMNTSGETIVSVAVPVRRFRNVSGALLLSTQGGDIDEIIAKERFALFEIFGVASLVMILLSLLLAGTIAGPIKRLSEAADRVRRGTQSRHEIPDMSDRHDEIGHLSESLRDMTKALYSRIEAIERFAADVAHELKNPLTSLRSAVETLPLAKSDDSRGRLLDVIQHDVKRLDRLISDISDASRLDAELARAQTHRFDFAALLSAVVSMANDARQAPSPTLELHMTPSSISHEVAPDYHIMGHDSRLSQVVTNLIENARSFSPPNSTVHLTLMQKDNNLELHVEDSGPGIPPHALERIFERFYTDRPEHKFGQNSGLGLSISRQIVEAHGGKIWAQNILDASSPEDPSKRLGARFIVRLPLANP